MKVIESTVTSSMTTLSEVEKEFKGRLSAYLRNAQFSQELWEALRTGYLSEAYVESMLFFNWQSSTKPKQMMEDGSRPTFFNMNIELGDFKADLQAFRSVGIPANTIMSWILDVTSNIGWNLFVPPQPDIETPPPSFVSPRRSD